MRRFSPWAGRIANPNIIHPVGKAPNDLENRREHVEMLVAIKMRKSQPCLLKKRDLRCNLLLDLMPADASEKGAMDKFRARAGKPSGFIDESRQDIGPKDGSLFNQRQMQANIQFRILLRQRDGIFECTPRHKQ
jgi:hypothetical protein